MEAATLPALVPTSGKVLVPEIVFGDPVEIDEALPLPVVARPARRRYPMPDVPCLGIIVDAYG